MKLKKWKPYLLWVLGAEAVGALSGWLSREGTARFQENAVKPPLNPPGWLFPVAWGILYALMGIGAARVAQSPPGAARSRGLNLYIAQLAVNFFWSLIFFNARAYGPALGWLLLLLALVALMYRAFRQTDALAAKLQLPYLLWLGFAAYLNLGVWILNG